MLGDGHGRLASESLAAKRNKSYIHHHKRQTPMAQLYPYPFIDVLKLGYSKVLFNSAMVCVVFIVFAVLFIGIAKMMNKRSA